MIKSKKFIFIVLTLTLACFAFFLEFNKDKSDRGDIERLIDEPADQISYIQIEKKSELFSFEKSIDGWNFVDPIKDKADDIAIEKMLTLLTTEPILTKIKPSLASGFTAADLAEYGMDNPLWTIKLKNNSGRSTKLTFGTVKNLENQAYVRLNNDQQISIVSSVLFDLAQNNIMYFREKKLYRHNLARLKEVHIKSLNENVRLVYQDGIWKNKDHDVAIDQSIVRSAIKNIAEAEIIEYLYDGEPSNKLLSDNSLLANYLEVAFITDDSLWGAKINVSSKNNGVYALTDRPTFLLKVDPAVWELIGNLNSDSIRDRHSAFRFNSKEVKKIFYKTNNITTELNFVDDGWVLNGGDTKISSNVVEKIIQNVSDLQIDMFIDMSDERLAFKGADMIILKSDKDKLLLQMNWGPEYKAEYAYARTQLSDLTFAMNLKNLEKINVENLIKK